MVYYLKSNNGIFWKSPLGKTRLIVIGITRSSNSFIEMSSEVIALTGISMNGGAPNDNCNARAPMILAFSNLVSVGGPINILPSALNSIASCCPSTSII